MTGDFAGHLFGSVDKVIAGKDGFEPGLGDGSRIVTGGTHSAEDLGSLAVLGRCDFFEVIERPVHLIAVDVVYLHAFGTRTNPSLPNESVARTGIEIAHTRISRTAIMIILARAKTGFKFAHDTSLIGNLHIADRKESSVL